MPVSRESTAAATHEPFMCAFVGGQCVYISVFPFVQGKGTRGAGNKRDWKQMQLRRVELLRTRKIKRVYALGEQIILQ